MHSALGPSLVNPLLPCLVVGMLFMAAALAHAAEPKGTEIIAHRGASHDAPENTLAAMKLGFEQGSDAGELDVWVTKDDVPVVIHDKDTKRVAGELCVVAEKTFAELQRLDVGKWKNEKYTGEKIPKLTDALALVPAGKRMFVEIKCEASHVPVILKAIDEAKLKPEQTAIISFDAGVVAAAKKARPDLLAYWIVSLKNDKGQAPKIPDFVNKAQAIGADGLDLSDSPLIDTASVTQIRAAKLGLYTWTVDDPAAAKRLVELGVDGITTNRPGWLREKLGR